MMQPKQETEMANLHRRLATLEQSMDPDRMWVVTIPYGLEGEALEAWERENPPPPGTSMEVRIVDFSNLPDDEE